LTEIKAEKEPHDREKNSVRGPHQHHEVFRLLPRMDRESENKDRSLKALENLQKKKAVRKRRVSDSASLGSGARLGKRKRGQKEAKKKESSIAQEKENG